MSGLYYKVRKLRELNTHKCISTTREIKESNGFGKSVQVDEETSTTERKRGHKD